MERKNQQTFNEKTERQTQTLIFETQSYEPNFVYKDLLVLNFDSIKILCFKIIF
jgi:hypothetical protein